MFWKFFKKFLPRGRTGFFLSPVGEISPQKKKRCCIMWLFLRVQQNLNHMGCSDAIHGWMTGRMDGTDGWKASRETTTMSFTICNRYWCKTSAAFQFQFQGWKMQPQNSQNIIIRLIIYHVSIWRSEPVLGGCLHRPSHTIRVICKISKRQHQNPEFGHKQGVINQKKPEEKNISIQRGWNPNTKCWVWAFHNEI
jgi:hypothetical protein